MPARNFIESGLKRFLVSIDYKLVTWLSKLQNKNSHRSNSHENWIRAISSNLISFWKIENILVGLIYNKTMRILKKFIRKLKTDKFY